MNIIKRELRTSLINILVWTLVFLFFSLASLMKFESLLETGDEMVALLDNFPRIVLALFNMVDVDLTSLPGYFSIVASYLLLMAASQGLFLGIRLFAKEEQDKTADFLLTKPRSRGHIFINKVTAGVLIILVLQAILFLCNWFSLRPYLPQAYTLLGNYTLAFITVHLLFFALGVMLINFLRRGRAETVGLSLMLMSYFIPVMANMSEDWYPIRDYFPFNTFLKSEMAEPGNTPLLKLGILLGILLIFLVVGYVKFKKKDIYV